MIEILSVTPRTDSNDVWPRASKRQRQPSYAFGTSLGETGAAGAAGAAGTVGAAGAAAAGAAGAAGAAAAGAGGTADAVEMLPESTVVPQLLHGAAACETTAVSPQPQSAVGAGSHDGAGALQDAAPPEHRAAFFAWSLASNPPPLQLFAAPQDSFFACRRARRPVRPPPQLELPPQSAIANEPKLLTTNAATAKAAIRTLIIRNSSERTINVIHTKLLDAHPVIMDRASTYLALPSMRLCDQQANSAQLPTFPIRGFA